MLLGGSWEEAIARMRTYLDMVNPHLVAAVQGDRITAPDVLRVELSNVDVLDDDTAGAICDPETGALDDAC